MAGSTVHRCPTNIEEDSFVDGVGYEDNDLFCLDGQRPAYNNNTCSYYFPDAPHV